MKLDETKLGEALRSVHGTLTRDEAKLIVDFARMAASADGRMDLGEMSMIARISRIIYAMANEAAPSVPSQLPDKSQLPELATQLPTGGARELAYTCAMLVMETDQKITTSEAALGTRLVELLELDSARASDLAAQMKQLVRS